MKKLFSLIALGMFALGCGAQVPPATPHVVNLSWTAPSSSASWAGCTAASPCTYAVYRCTVGATCSDQTSTAWKEVTSPTSRPSSLAFTDPTASGLTVNYIVETIQGVSNSAPSNTTQVTVPGTPLAPALNSPVTANNAMPQVKPALPKTSNPMLASVKLTAKVSGL